MREFVLSLVFAVGVFLVVMAVARPTITIYTDSDCYAAGEAIEVSLSADNDDEAISVDLYVGIVLPDGDIWSVQCNGWSHSVEPWIPDIHVPAWFEMSCTPYWTFDLPCEVPPIGEEGEYSFAAGLTVPGTVEFVSDICCSSFRVSQQSDFHGGYVTKDMALSGRIELTSDVIIQQQAVLAVLPGSSVGLGPDVGIHVFGGLIAEGEEENPIIFERLKPGEAWENISFWMSANDSKCRLVRCTITGGSGTFSAGLHRGGGVFCWRCSPTIEKNTITGNFAAHDGGGIFCYRSSPSIEDNIMTDNRAGDNGGGILCDRSNPTITRNTIVGNSVIWGRGGGIHCVRRSCPLINYNTISENWLEGASAGAGISCSPSCSPVIEHNLISDNSIQGRDGEGGGIGCFSNSTIIRGNVITGNSSSYRGGGIFCHSGSETIRNNIITGNSATHYGGGIACAWYSNPIIESNDISNNSADGGSGGGIYCVVESCPSILANTIIGNSADLKGGGMYCTRNSSPSIWNNAIAGNSAWDGGAMYCDECSSVIAHNTIAGNVASWDGGGICCASSILPTITDCIMWGNSASTGPNLHECCLPSFSCIEGWDGTGEGNIYDAPMFVVGPLGEYYLHPDSPCIDAGSRSAEDAGLSDRTTQAAQTTDTGTVDMGFHYAIANDE